MPAFELLGGEGHGGALLDSALGEPRQTFGGRFLYRTIYDKAGALFRSLVKNHPLKDGNKRLALTGTEVFLLINGYVLVAPQAEKATFALMVAASEPDTPWQEISAWFRQRAVKFEGFLDILESHGIVKVEDRETLRQLYGVMVTGIKSHLTS